MSHLPESQQPGGLFGPPFFENAYAGDMGNQGRSDEGAQALARLLVISRSPLSARRPPAPGWQYVTANDDDIESWFHQYPDALNTGIITRNTPAVDIDVYDPDVADEIEATAVGHDRHPRHGSLRSAAEACRAVPHRSAVRQDFNAGVHLSRRSSGTALRCCATVSKSWYGTHPAPASLSLARRRTRRGGPWRSARTHRRR